MSRSHLLFLRFIVVINTICLMSASCRMRAPSAHVKSEQTDFRAKNINDLTEDELDAVVERIQDLLWPTGDDTVKNDLYWCAIYAIWSAFPVAKIGKTELKQFIKNNASGRGGRVIDLYNSLEGLKKLATGEPVSFQNRLTQAFSLMQLLNYQLGGAKVVSGFLNIADVLSQCGIAIINGADQLIKDINAITQEYSVSEVWNASIDAHGDVVGALVFVVIECGSVVTYTGDQIGEVIGGWLYPNQSINGIQRQNEVQCCTIARVYQYWNGIKWRHCDYSDGNQLIWMSREISHPYDELIVEDAGPRVCKGDQYDREDIRVSIKAFNCEWVRHGTCR